MTQPDTNIRGEDLEISAYPDPLYPAHGMVVGLPRPIVKVMHKPTGIFAVCGYEKSHHKNRTIAMRMVEYGLAEMGIKI
jgi:protein subunit release factor A